MPTQIIKVQVSKSGSIPHFHYYGTDKGLVEYDMADKLSDGEIGYLHFYPEYPFCPKCKSNRLTKAGTNTGVQRWRCSYCKTSFGNVEPIHANTAIQVSEGGK